MSTAGWVVAGILAGIVVLAVLALLLRTRLLASFRLRTAADRAAALRP